MLQVRRNGGGSLLRLGFASDFGKLPIHLMHLLDHLFLCFSHIVKIDQDERNEHQKEQEEKDWI
jgi:hypothetical protein